MDQHFIAALLTVIGYSINDTVVVYDRLREYLGLPLAHKQNYGETINRAINSTLSRTIITSLTVIFVMAILFFFGGEVIKSFSFAIFIGIIVATYSSIFIASPIIADFAEDATPEESAAAARAKAVKA